MYGWLSLVPSLVAIVLAIATRRVILSMFIAVVVGALITNQWQFVPALGDTFEIHLWKTLSDDSRLRVFAFTMLMAAMVGVIQKSGGMTGLVNVVSRWASNRRRGQLSTWLTGMLVFFDDYANTVLLGRTFQPLADRLRISREKLAYLVDSTAAPVAGLALISTWVAGEISYVADGLNVIGQSEHVTPFSLFIASIPYRFYVLWTLFFVFLVSAMNRDFGPMRKAELQAIKQPHAVKQEHDSDEQEKVSGWWNAIIPVLATIVAVLWLLIVTGKAAADGLSDKPIADLTLTDYRNIFGNADSYYALLWGSLFGLFVAVAITWGQRLLTWHECTQAAADGTKLILPSLVVLWLASSISTMTGSDPIEGVSKDVTSYRLSTGKFLASLIQPDKDVVDSQNTTTQEDSETDANLPQIDASILRWMPTIIFVLSAAVSFSTGTSWGTMALVMPIAISLTFPLLADDAMWHVHPIMNCTIGSVLAGAIFGDHCSPISDTTVLSSQSCGCDHTAHVWTQMPYALVVGTVAILFGTLPIGFGVPVQVLLPIGSVVLVFFLVFVGKTVPETEN